MDYILNSLHQAVDLYRQNYMLMQEAYKNTPEGNLLIRHLPSSKYSSKHNKLVLKKDNKVKRYAIQYLDPINNVRKQRLLKDDEDELLNQLIAKSVLRKAMPICENNIKWTDKLIEKLQDISIPEIVQAIAELNRSETIPNLNSILYVNSLNWIDEELWDNLKSYQNQYHTENLLNGGRNGNYRSKSEIIISNILEINKITFKYEVEIQINGRTVFPDFVMRRKSDGRIIFWEHCGLITDTDYAEKMYKKILDYAASGITLWDNLILTFDRPDGTIDTNTIQNIINLFIAN